jgi:hypothetical protein
MRRWGPLFLIVLGLTAMACGDDAPPSDATDDSSARPASTQQSAAPQDTPPGGEVFTDPEGTYEIDVGPTWSMGDASALGAQAAEIEFWDVGSRAEGLQPNINIQTQATGGMSLEEFLRISTEGPTAVPNIIESDVTTSSSGDPMILLEYQTRVLPDVPQQHLTAVAIASGADTVLATFTAANAAYDELIAEVEPYLLTLRAR